MCPFTFEGAGCAMTRLNPAVRDTDTVVMHNVIRQAHGTSIGVSAPSVMPPTELIAAMPTLASVVHGSAPKLWAAFEQFEPFSVTAE